MSNWFELEHLGAISLHGKGALKFANSQFTSDIVNEPENRWETTSWCDSKGRVISVVLIAARDGAVDLVLPRDQVEPVSARLQLFAIGHEVEIVPGGSAAGKFEGGNTSGALAHDPGRRLILRPVDGSPDNAPALCDWRLSDLRSGYPWLDTHTASRHLPQFLGLESFDAISYHKGCYPGQEIIARLHYLGKAKYRLHGLIFADGADIPPTTPILDESGRQIGETLYGISVDSQFASLAVLASTVVCGQPIRAEVGGQRHPGEVTDPQTLC